MLAEAQVTLPPLSNVSHVALSAKEEQQAGVGLESALQVTEVELLKVLH